MGYLPHHHLELVGATKVGTDYNAYYNKEWNEREREETNRQDDSAIQVSKRWEAAWTAMDKLELGGVLDLASGDDEFGGFQVESKFKWKGPNDPNTHNFLNK